MLEGTLESFTLPDIFQLLAFTKKTGCLKLERNGASGRVYFDDGEVYYALSSGGRLALGRRLVGAGEVDTDQLRAALDKQRELADDGEGLRLGQILLDQDAIDQDTLETFVREQIQDAIFDLMRWDDGNFSFDSESDEATVDEPIELSVTVENLIMEGSRRLEEWENVKKKIPSMDAVVAMQPRPGDDEVEVNLRPEEWQLLTLVDGQRTVGDLVDIYGQGQFSTCKLLFGLVGAGLLEVRDVETEGPPSVAALLQQRELLRELEKQEDERAREGRLRKERLGDDRPAADTAGDDEGGSEEAEPPEDEATPAAEEVEVETEPQDEGPADEDSDGQPDPSGNGDQRLTTDPDIDEDLVQRLIEGVKGL
ncbi:MAG: DUF4388 domain-containing protein [Nitriliruptorales bacterium]|nr:DUF4388 domain-containing protein [Nitriliruptorales bacterium]